MKSHFYIPAFLSGILFFFSGCGTETYSHSDTKQITIDSVSFFTGTYTRNEGWVNGKADGIYQFTTEWEQDSLLSSTDTLVAEVVNPSFLAASPDGQYIYAVSELGRSGESGLLYTFKADKYLSLTQIDKDATNGQSPAHVAVHPSGNFIFSANYNGGKATVYQRGENESLDELIQLEHSGSGPHPNQNASHLHMVKVSPDGNYFYIPDLGSDRIWSYSIDTGTGEIAKTEQKFVSLEPGSGPRHMDFHPGGNFAYIINELNSTISVFEYDPEDGSLHEIQNISTLPEDFAGQNSTADIHVHPNGQFLYGSNRGHNSIVSFSIDETSGQLSLLSHTPTEGEVPRNFAIHSTGKFLYAANQNTDNITVFVLDEETGALSYTGTSIKTPTPVCILFY